jgi:hypothetical protein
MRTPHTSFYKGSKIRIILRTNEVIIAKFINKIGKRAIETDQGVFLIPNIKSANYYKPLPHELIS